MAWPNSGGGNGGGGIAVDSGIPAVAAVSIPAGRLIYINSAGKMALADATAEGKEAVGFTKLAVLANAQGTYYTSGVIPNQSGLTPGNSYFMTTNPGVIGAYPTATGNVVQRIGIAGSATEVVFLPQPPITL